MIDNITHFTPLQPNNSYAPSQSLDDARKSTSCRHPAASNLESRAFGMLLWYKDTDDVSSVACSRGFAFIPTVFVDV